MEGKNAILITLDEVRHDRLSCYGYQGIETPNIDFFAENGVRFETAVSATSFTPVSHGTILTGLNPNKHNLRDPFSAIEGKMISEIFQENGYATAGFVGVNLLGAANGFNRGFQDFDEPRHEEVWKRTDFPGDERGELLWGNWWVPRMLKWVKAHADRPFFIWAHYFDVHQAAEDILLEMGKIQEGVKPEFGYYDPKIEYMDKALFGPLRETLEDLKIGERTTTLIVSDHGTNFGEHEVPPFPHLNLVYPQHTTLYDCDLLIPMILKDRDLPKNVVIPGMVRTVDIVPTLIELAGLPSTVKYDGTSLVSFISAGKAEGLIHYAEELYEKRGPGDFQAIRSDQYKFIVDYRNNGKEEFYDLQVDPNEQKNLISDLTDEQRKLVEEWRALCEENKIQKQSDFTMEDKAKAKVEERLKMLGYIE